MTWHDSDILCRRRHLHDSASEAEACNTLGDQIDAYRPAAAQDEIWARTARAGYYGPRARVAVGAIIIGLAVLIGVVLFALGMAHPAGAAPSPCPGDAAGCAGFVTPATYGPPGPNGGPR